MNTQAPKGITENDVHEMWNDALNGHALNETKPHHVASFARAIVARAALAAADADQAPEPTESQMNAAIAAYDAAWNPANLGRGNKEEALLAAFKAFGAARPAPVGAVPAPTMGQMIALMREARDIAPNLTTVDPIALTPIQVAWIVGKLRAAAPAAPIGATPTASDMIRTIRKAEHAKPEPVERQPIIGQGDGKACAAALSEWTLRDMPEVEQAKLAEGATPTSIAWHHWVSTYDGVMNSVSAFGAGYQAGQQAGAVDGERYRWLRAVYGQQFRITPGPVFMAETPEQLDAAIDLCRAASANQGGE